MPDTTGFTRRGLLVGGAALAVAGAAPAHAQAWPNRPLQMLVPWGAGGGTDATARIMATILERELGQPINVVNRTGGSGVIGHTAIATATPDGYTIGMITVEIAMMHWQGLTELQPRNFTPLGLVNADPPAITVRADAPWRTVREFADALRAAPAGRMKASGTGQGGIWHLGLVAFLQGLGLAANHVAWVPSQGAAPGLQDLVAGGIDLVTCSLPEARALIEAGRVRTLAVMAPDRSQLFPNIPTLAQEMNITASTPAWRVLAGPRNMPQPVVDRLATAIQRAYNSNEYKEFMTGRGFGMVYANPADTGRFMEEQNTQMGQAMRAAGLARSS